MSIQLNNLVKNFDKNLEYYKKRNNNYNEADTRKEYIDPFFELLGWDLINRNEVKPEFREVLLENYINEGQKPDYTFTLNGVSKFFVEAKKPSVDITTDFDSVFQARKYGWSASHPVVVLTNFEYLLIYDTTIPPHYNDSINVGLIKKYHFKDYKKYWNEINSLLSRKIVYKGEFEEKFNFLLKKEKYINVDDHFLKQINEWRIKLANYLYKEEHELSSELINDLTQQFINQIIFLRICEDRNLPLYHKLQETIDNADKVQEKLMEVFKHADNKYNSGLFSGEYIIFDLDNEVIMEMIKKLYYPQSPYAFSV